MKTLILILLSVSVIAQNKPSLATELYDPDSTHSGWVGYASFPNSYTFCPMYISTGKTVSRILYTQGYGFNLPELARVDSIKAVIVRSRAGSPNGDISPVQDLTISLCRNYNLIGRNYAKPGLWKHGYDTITYSIDPVSVSAINNYSFGLAVQVQHAGTFDYAEANIFSITLRVYYNTITSIKVSGNMPVSQVYYDMTGSEIEKPKGYYIQDRTLKFRVD